MKLYITAHAKELRDIRSEITRQTKPLIKHLIKLFLYPYAQAQEHWITEIYGFLNQVDKQKKDNKFPKYDTLMDLIWWDNEDNFSKYLKDVRSKYFAETESGLTFNELYDVCQEYCEWLSEILSKDGEVDKFVIQKELHKLLGID